MNDIVSDHQKYFKYDLLYLDLALIVIVSVTGISSVSLQLKVVKPQPKSGSDGVYETSKCIWPAQAAAVHYTQLCQRFADLAL